MHEEETKKRIEELSINIGKRCKITSSPISLIVGKTGTVIKVHGQFPDSFVAYFSYGTNSA